MQDSDQKIIILIIILFIVNTVYLAAKSYTRNV